MVAKLLLGLIAWYIYACYFKPVQFVTFHVFVNLTRIVNIVIGIGASRNRYGSWQRHIKIYRLEITGSLSKVGRMNNEGVLTFYRFVKISWVGLHDLSLWIYTHSEWEWQYIYYDHQPVGTTFKWR